MDIFDCEILTQQIWQRWDNAIGKVGLHQELTWLQLHWIMWQQHVASLAPSLSLITLTFNETLYNDLRYTWLQIITV